MASSVPDAVTGAHVVITLLPAAAVANSVIFGDGVAGASPKGCVWAQTGTIGVTETLGIRDQLAARRPGVVIVNAPVSGSKDPAERGQLLNLADGRPMFHGHARLRAVERGIGMREPAGVSTVYMQPSADTL